MDQEIQEQPRIDKSEPEKMLERDKSQRHGIRLLITAAMTTAIGTAAVAEGADPRVVIMAGAVAAAATTKAEEIMRFAKEIALGTRDITVDAAKGTVHGAVNLSVGAVEGAASLGVKGAKGAVGLGSEARKNTAVLVSGITKHGRESLGTLHEKRRELADLNVEDFKDEVIGRYNEVADFHREYVYRSKALHEICIELADGHKMSPGEANAVMRELKKRLLKARGEEEPIPAWLKLRRFMSSITVKNVAHKVDEVVYGTVFAGAKRRVERKIGSTEAEIESKKEGFMRQRVDNQGELVRRGGYQLLDIDAETERLAADFNDNISVDIEVMREYAIELGGDSSEESYADLDQEVRDRAAVKRQADDDKAKSEMIRKEMEERKARRKMNGDKRHGIGIPMQEKGNRRAETPKKNEDSEKVPDILSDKEKDEQIAFVRDRFNARWNEPVPGEERDWTGSLNNYIFKIMATNSDERRRIAAMLWKDPEAAWEIIRPALAGAYIDTMSEVNDEYLQYKNAKKAERGRSARS